MRSTKSARSIGSLGKHLKGSSLYEVPATMTPRLKTGRGITGLVRYVMGEGNKDRPLEPGQKSRVAWVGGTGFPGVKIETAADVELARKVMEFASLNGRSTT